MKHHIFTKNNQFLGLQEKPAMYTRALVSIGQKADTWDPCIYKLASRRNNTCIKGALILRENVARLNLSTIQEPAR